MKLRETFVIRNILDEYVAVSIDDKQPATSSVINLNETGKRIFELIQEGKEEDAIVATLLDEYEATEEDVRTAVRGIIAQLEDKNLLLR